MVARKLSSIMWVVRSKKQGDYVNILAQSPCQPKRKVRRKRSY